MVFLLMKITLSALLILLTLPVSLGAESNFSEGKTLTKIEPNLDGSNNLNDIVKKTLAGILDKNNELYISQFDSRPTYYCGLHLNNAKYAIKEKELAYILPKKHYIFYSPIIYETWTPITGEHKTYKVWSIRAN